MTINDHQKIELSFVYLSLKSGILLHVPLVFQL